MKNIVNFITESAPKYVFSWILKNGRSDRVAINDYKDVLSEIAGEYKYYEVMKNSSSNFSEVDGLVEWSGEGGYWANVLDRAENPEKYPEKIYGRPWKSSDIEKVKRAKK